MEDDARDHRPCDHPEQFVGVVESFLEEQQSEQNRCQTAGSEPPDEGDGGRAAPVPIIDTATGARRPIVSAATAQSTTANVNADRPVLSDRLVGARTYGRWFAAQPSHAMPESAMVHEQRVRWGR